MEYCGLCPDLIGQVLSRVPLKPRTRFMVVCKTWCDLITKIPQYPCGFICWNDWPSPKTSFLRQKDDSNNSFEVVLPTVECYFPGASLLNSCDGLLLYATVLPAQPNRYDKFIICSPLKMQYIAIEAPPEMNARDYLNFAYVDFDDSNQTFKVICYTCSEARPMSSYIFSSETRNWEIKTESLRRMPDSCYTNVKFSSFRVNGKLHAIGGSNSWCLVDIERFQVQPISSPVKSRSVVHSRAFWESDDGSLYCCVCYRKAFEIYYRSGSCNWQRLQHKTTTRPIKKIIEELIPRGEENEYNSYDFRVLNLINTKMQTLYFGVANSIFEYSLKTRTFKLVLFDPLDFDDDLALKSLFPFTFKPIHLSDYIQGCNADAGSYN
ncbi:hypothetical protein ACFE04_005622 [Oxalis oulophora]